MNVLRNGEAGELRSRECGQVRHGTEGAAGVGTLRTSVHVEQLGGSDEDYEDDAEECNQNP